MNKLIYLSFVVLAVPVAGLIVAGLVFVACLAVLVSFAHELLTGPVSSRGPWPL